MKQKLAMILLIFLTISACMPPQQTLTPVETLVAQTLAAMPKTDTPIVRPTEVPSATPTSPKEQSTPELDLSMPGAYCLPVNTTRTQGLVTKVLSGDSIEVLITNQTYQVRYIGLDSPIVVAPIEWQGPQAMSFNQSLVEGKYVTLVQDVSDQDSDGFYPRYVIIGQTFVNYEMALQGFGAMKSSPPDTACDNALIAAQVEAQNAVRGMWIGTPVPTSTITLTATATTKPTKTRKPTATLAPACNCLSRKALTCSSFASQAQAQACYDYCRSLGFGDVFGLDKNGNGLACEGS
jgi:micrococcal nuclease